MWVDTVTAQDPELTRGTGLPHIQNACGDPDGNS